MRNCCEQVNPHSRRCGTLAPDCDLSLLHMVSLSKIAVKEQTHLESTGREPLGRELGAERLKAKALR